LAVYHRMKIPSIEEAQALMAEAGGRNPGPWVSHSRCVAEAAEAIAREHPSLDLQAAFILGYLHDIGRQEGGMHMRHIFDGYHFLSGQGYEEAARICLTHSFPIKNIRAIVGAWEGCSEAELAFLQDYLDHIEYDPYDKLIQLCDALALPSGCCLIEKRLVDVTIRYGTNEFSVLRWKAFLGLQQEFEQAIHASIYDLLPGVKENTFQTNLLSIISNRH